MQTLTQLLKQFADETDSRWWVGDRPKVLERDLPMEIAAQIGLPTPSASPFTNKGLDRLDRAHAAHVLAVAGTTSLAYDNCSPSTGTVNLAECALADLAKDAVFFSNGRWEAGRSRGWKSLTSATFDCGVIGFDSNHAFIFWVEEED